MSFGPKRKMRTYDDRYRQPRGNGVGSFFEFLQAASSKPAPPQCDIKVGTVIDESEPRDHATRAQSPEDVNARSHPSRSDQPSSQQRRIISVFEASMSGETTRFRSTFRLWRARCWAMSTPGISSRRSSLTATVMCRYPCRAPETASHRKSRARRFGCHPSTPGCDRA